MKRWTFRIMLCLMLGVVTTVAVAIGATRSNRYINFASRTVNLETLSWSDRDASDVGGYIPPASRYHDTFEQIRLLFDAHVPRQGTEFVSSINVGYFSGVLSDETAINGWGYDHTPWTFADGIDVLLSEVRINVGWPARALFARRRVFTPAVDIEFERHVLFASSYQARAYVDAGYLPRLDLRPELYRPIFPGFLIDTLFYAVIWFGLFFGIGAARRTVRRKRGRCVKCGYDLRGTPDDVGGPGAGCSECGWGREDGTTNDELRATNEA